MDTALPGPRESAHGREVRGRESGHGPVPRETLGTGRGLRTETVQVQVLPQGQVPAGYDASKAACVR